jgi:hypothetical protein
MLGKDRLGRFLGCEAAIRRIPEPAIYAGEFVRRRTIGAGVKLRVDLARELGQFFLRGIGPIAGTMDDKVEKSAHGIILSAERQPP